MNDTELSRMLKLNEERRSRLFAHYNPFTGEGSPIARSEFQLTRNEYIYIPQYLADTPLVKEIMAAGTAEDYARAKGLAWNKFQDALTKLRIKYDFEFWAATCCHIKDKVSGEIVPFVLWNPQFPLLKMLVDDWSAGKPIRIIICKARQWGGSTLVQMFFAWIQLWHCVNWNSVIVAHIKKAAQNVRAMYSRMARHHPKKIMTVCLVNFEGSQDKEVAGRGSVISIGSMETPDSLRSDDIKLVHMTEVGMWRKTDGKDPEDVAGSIIPSVPNESNTAVILESTAKGVGNYFHNTWTAAESGENAYKPLFVPWFEIPYNFLSFASKRECTDFINSMTGYEHFLFEQGATLEGINWYRSKRREMSDDLHMKRDFPSTPAEAFATTTNHAHDPLYIAQLRPFTKPPLYRGEIKADANFGQTAIGPSLHFMETASGDLWLWGLPDKERKVSDRYVVSLDIGGRSSGADWSVISVVDRYHLLHGGIEECIGTYRFHLDQDLTVWRAVQVAKFFNDALLVVESNSLNDKGQEGDHSITILDEIKDYYPNLYYRDDPQKIREGMPERYGFHTNRATKTDLVNQMNKRFREVLHIERDKRALDEAELYELKPDGSYGAFAGQHDDIYMSRALALKASDTMPLPCLIRERNHPRSNSNSTVIATEASI